MARIERKYRKDATGRKVLQGFIGVFSDPHRHPNRKRVPLGKDEKAARARLTKLEREYALGIFDPWTDAVRRSGTPVDKARQAFLKTKEGLSPATVDGYESILGLFEKSLPPGMVMQSVQARHVVDFLDASRETERKGTPYKLASASRASYVRHLRAFFKWAVKSGHMQADPTPTRELNRKGPRRTVPPFLSEDQFDQLIRLIESDGILSKSPDGHRWLVNAVRFAVGTGLRRGELCNLRWSAVDLSSGFIYVKNEEGREGAKAFRTKTGSERAVPLVGSALDIVEALYAARSGEADGYVLTGAKGGQMNADFLTKRFRDFRKAAGLPSVINFHSLRHTFASWWVLRGGDIYRLKEVLGHSDIQTTMIYAHLRPDALREEALKTHGRAGAAGAAGANADLLARLEALEAENAALRQGFEV